MWYRGILLPLCISKEFAFYLFWALNDRCFLPLAFRTNGSDEILFKSIPDLLHMYHWWSQWLLLPEGIMLLLPVPYFDTNLFPCFPERKWLWFKGHIQVVASKSVLSPKTVVAQDVMKIFFHQFIFFIFLHTGNSLVCFPTQRYIFFSGGTGELDTDLMLVQDLRTFQSPACPLILPIQKVYMLNIYKQCWIMVCSMNTENKYMVDF